MASTVAFYIVATDGSIVPEPIETTSPEGVDYGWVMQVTFVTTLILGVPIVAGLSTFVELSSWADRATFAVQVGAAVWFVTAIAVFAYARTALST